MTPFSTRLATCFGIGWIPRAPGTFASAAALPLGWILVTAGWPVLLIGAAVATLAGIWACGIHARRVGLYDPSECVLDEVAGQWFALLPIAFYVRGSDWRLYGIAFLLFRLFDIFKPWPISAAEKLPGGFGVMMDDVVAGLAAAVLLYGALSIKWI
ncbi:MAG TPA: phosphatidylglycerophosphatase A [Micropepsaceae bacterium]|jgi:phosphatidylglycerophosphatase A|nr:phosphatidylglycerophosphatase A [Micropepsaceae bacterium]